jgi:cytochrome c556
MVRNKKEHLPMRSLVLLLVGLMVGALCTSFVMKALDRKSAYPRAVMTMMGQQMKALDSSVKQARCASTDLVPRLQTLRFVANDIEPAFVGLKDEAQFGRYAADLRAAADAALMAPPSTCVAAAAEITNLSKACDSCHRDYKD